MTSIPLAICILRVFKILYSCTSKRASTKAPSIHSSCLKFNRELIIELVSKMWPSPKIGSLYMLRVCQIQNCRPLDSL